MKKRIISLLLLTAMVLSLSGCIRALSVPKDPKIFEKDFMEGDSVNPNYTILLCDGKTYVPFGVFSGNYGNLVDSCIGYINESDSVLENRLICTIVGDTSGNYIASMDTNYRVDPIIWRDYSTKGDSYIPDAVKSSGFPIWN